MPPLCKGIRSREGKLLKDKKTKACVIPCIRLVNPDKSKRKECHQYANLRKRKGLLTLKNMILDQIDKEVKGEEEYITRDLIKLLDDISSDKAEVYKQKINDDPVKLLRHVLWVNDQTYLDVEDDFLIGDFLEKLGEPRLDPNPPKKKFFELHPCMRVKYLKRKKIYQEDLNRRVGSAEWTTKPVFIKAVDLFPNCKCRMGLKPK